MTAITDESDHIQLPANTCLFPLRLSNSGQATLISIAARLDSFQSATAIMAAVSPRPPKKRETHEPLILEATTMPATQFDRDSMAQWYAGEHLKTDPGIVAVHFLPANAGEREIRFVEVNKLIGDRNDEALEPIDFGVETGTANAHKLFVLDVTPQQWERIKARELSLPGDWSLDGAISIMQ